MTEYIERDRLYELGYWHGATPTLDNPFPDGVDAVDTKDIDSIPAADVRPAEDYNKLLKAAKAMHTWIFLNTRDEQAVYDECHLDDEMNALLGYGGSFEIRMRGEEE